MRVKKRSTDDPCCKVKGNDNTNIVLLAESICRICTNAALSFMYNSELQAGS